MYRAGILTFDGGFMDSSSPKRRRRHFVVKAGDKYERLSTNPKGEVLMAHRRFPMA